MKRIILCIVIIFVFANVLCSCEDNGKNSNDIIVKTIDNIGGYTIIRPENASDCVRNAAAELQTFFLKNCSIKVLISDDTSKTQSKEIIVGNTSRELDSNAFDGLKLNEFAIKLIGNKIVIIGGSDKATENAVDFFMDVLVVENTIKAPKEGFYYKDNKLLESIMVEGTSLAEYTIVSNLFSIDTAKEFSEKLFNATSLRLPIVKIEDFDFSNGKYILLDDTNTDFSKYSVDIKDGNVTFFANYASIDNCIDYFIGEIIGYDEQTGKLKGGNAIKIGKEQSQLFNVEQKQIYTKEKLLKVLETVYNDDSSIIIGQQMTELFAPVGGLVEKERAQYLENCGVETPMLGYDLGTLEYYEKRRSESGVVKEAYDLIQFMREGGIVTFSMHLDNPGPERDLDHYRGELRQNEWDEMFTEGTEINRNIMETLSYIGDFLEIFKINEAPVILRPLHESNGNWFWFCTISGEENTLLPQSYLVNFWKLIYDYFVNDRGIDNMLWEYSPNATSGTSSSIVDALYCYPGDEYVDLVSADWYTDSKTDTGILEKTVNALSETGKIFSMSEFGPAGDLVTNLDISNEYKFDCMDVDKMITSLREKEVKIAYWLLWSSYANVKISMWNMGNAEFFYENDVYLTLDDTYELLYK